MPTTTTDSFKRRDGEGDPGTFLGPIWPLKDESKAAVRLNRLRPLQQTRHPFVEGAIKSTLKNFVRDADEEGGNPALYKAAARLGKFIPDGHLTEAEVEEILTKANEDVGASDADRAIANGIEAGKADPMTIPSLGDEEEDEDYYETLRKGSYTIPGLADIPPLSPLVEGVLFKGTLSFSIGPPGNGKSFGMVDLLGCVATGKDWFGRRTYPGPVVYAPFEGLEGLHQRFIGWQNYHGKQIEQAVVQTVIPRLSDTARYAKFIHYMAKEVKPVLIIVDTFAWMASGMNTEGDNDAMQLAGEELMRLVKATGAAVHVVHHTRKTNEKITMNDFRGSSSMAGLIETMLGFQQDQETRVITVSCLKQKDVAHFTDFDCVLAEAPDADHKALIAADGSGSSISDEVLQRVVEKWKGDVGHEWMSVSQLKEYHIIGEGQWLTMKRHLLEKNLIDGPHMRGNVEQFRVPPSTEEAMISYGD